MKGKNLIGFLLVFLAVCVCDLQGQCAGKNYSTDIIVEDFESETEVLRVYGNTRYNTAYAIADQLKIALGIEKFETVVIASGSNFPDALSGSYLASMKQAPILLAKDKYVDDLHSYVKENLTSGGTIYVLGGATAVPDSIVEELNQNYRVIRLEGKTRYETNLEILKEVGVQEKDILICTGKGYADSLSVSALGKPILLVGKTLTDEQKNFLQEHSDNACYIIGGTDVVDEYVQAEIEEIVKTERISGSNRYATSVLVAETFCDTSTVATLAYAKNYPDGLCGGPLANAVNAPLILTAAGKEENAVDYVDTNNIEEGISFGGSAILSDKVVAGIFGYVGNVKKEKYELAVVHLEAAERFLRVNDLEKGIVALEQVYDITRDDTITNFIKTLRKGEYNTQGIELKLGRAKKVDLYGADGEHYAHYENIYDDLGRWTETNAGEWYDKFVYDVNGNHIKTESFIRDSGNGGFRLFEWSENQFDESGNCVKEEDYSKNYITNSFYQRSYFLNYYDSAGNYEGFDYYSNEMASYYDITIPRGQVRYEYDDDGRTAVEWYFGYKNDPITKTKYLYDYKGRCIEERETYEEEGYSSYGSVVVYRYEDTFEYTKEKCYYDGELTGYDVYTYDETKLYIEMNSHRNFTGYYIRV